VGAFEDVYGSITWRIKAYDNQNKQILSSEALTGHSLEMIEKTWLVLIDKFKNDEKEKKNNIIKQIAS
jgi:hypothetical protein